MINQFKEFESLELTAKWNEMGAWFIADREGKALALSFEREPFSPNKEANEALMHFFAAAPTLLRQRDELLEALEEILQWSGTVNFSSHKQMREAIEWTVEKCDEAINNIKNEEQ